MYLGCEFPVLQIFGFGDGSVDMDGEAGDVLYACYLQMARAGLVSLEMWDPKSRKWGQAHSQARFSILQVSNRPVYAPRQSVCSIAYNVNSASCKRATASASLSLIATTSPT